MASPAKPVLVRPGIGRSVLFDRPEVEVQLLGQLAFESNFMGFGDFKKSDRCQDMAQWQCLSREQLITSMRKHRQVLPWRTSEKAGMVTSKATVALIQDVLGIRAYGLGCYCFEYPDLPIYSYIILQGCRI